MACEERNRKHEVCLGGKSQKDEERPDEAGNDDEERKSCRKDKRCWNSVTSVPGNQGTHCRGTHKDLMRNKHGKVVSKKAHARGKKLVSSGIGKWAKAVMKARKELNITGFCAVKKGTKLYNLARSYYD